MEPISEVKEIVQKLESKLKSTETSGYGKKETFEEFVKPLFESLGWDFATDVSKEESVSQNKADYGFKINDVTRFYLTTVPLDQSLEDRKLIIPLTTFAFNRGVTWGVLTNFRKTRLFMSEARGRSPDHMQFFELSSEEFLSKFEKLSYLTKKSLSLNTLDSDAVYFAKKQKKTPIDQQLLEDLLDYRDRLSKNIIKNNPKLTQEQVSHSAQKILNRFIFIRSCGDRQIEERHLQSSLNQWREEKKKRDLIEYVRNIFSEFRGRYGSSLFEKHICDNLQISNIVLEEVIEGLYQSENKAVRYDFSLISSDILGKMYENYLGTIQRKQDGAYYTPSYISKYIAENTIIPYLSKSNVTNISDLISEYTDNIKELESKIHNLKILDPACGTGEFLIRAIDILLEILKEIQNHKEKSGKYSHTGKKKKSESVTYATFDKEIESKELRTIIQNNIFGVDINEEAIEITQLNLFLKLATSSQQLLDVSKNLRVGNSLVDDKSIDPKAFDWEKTFPEKFDIVIGNPPYVRQEEILNIKPNLEKRFSVYHGMCDLYVYFYELALNLLKAEGKLCFITSNKWMKTSYGENLRKILSKMHIVKLIDFGFIQIFEGATTYPQIIFISNTEKQNSHVEVCNINDSDFPKSRHTITYSIFLQYFQQHKFSVSIKQFGVNDWNIIPERQLEILNKIKKISKRLEEYAGDEDYRGVVTGLNKAFVIDKTAKDLLIKEDPKSKEVIKPYLDGKDVARYWIKTKNKFLIFTRRGINIEKYPAVKAYLSKFKSDLSPKKNRTDKIGRKPGLYKWYEIQDSTAYFEEFEKPKIIYGRIITKPRFVIDYDGFYVSAANSIIHRPEKKIIGIFNSKLGEFLIKNMCTFLRGGYQLMWDDFKNVPISQNNSKNLEQLITDMLSLNKQLQNEKQDDKKSEIEKKISKTDQSIEEEVYKLYNITDEEKKIIESSL